ncbi:MAG: Na+/H+ antiporter subunit E [Bacillota bacterium]
MKRSFLPILIFGFALMAFWISVSGTLHWQHLLVGLVTVSAVTLANLGMISKLKPAEHGFRPLLLGRILFNLLVDIVRANFQVARIVLSRDMPIEPRIVTFESKLRLPMSKAFLANAITLTPGTLTVDVEGQKFVVHCLTRESAETLREWDVRRLIGEMEKGDG